MNCVVCGTHLQPNSRFCHMCGAAIQVSQVATSGLPSQDRVLVTQKTPVVSLAFSQDTRILATGGEETHLWQVDDGIFIRSLVGQYRKVTKIGFSLDDTYIYTWDGSHFSSWHMSNGRLVDKPIEVRSLHKDFNNVRDMCLFVGSDSDVCGYVYQESYTYGDYNMQNNIFWQFRSLPDFSSITRLKIHDLHPIRLSAGGQFIAGFSKDSIVVFERKRGLLGERIEICIVIDTKKEHPTGVMHIALSEDGELLASIDSEYRLVIWEIHKNIVIEEDLRDLYPGHVRELLFSPDSDTVAIVAGNKVQIRNTLDGAVIRNLEGHTAPVTCLSFSSDNELLASGSEDKTVRLWTL